MFNRAKSLGKDLCKGIRQSDDELLTPFQQAKKYIVELLVSKYPKWVLTCNFSEFLVYDMDKPHGESEHIFLKALPSRLGFLVNTEDKHIRREMETSLKAGELVGKFYNAILKQYHNSESLTKHCGVGICSTCGWCSAFELKMRVFSGGTICYTII